jgi:hypothetical protein
MNGKSNALENIDEKIKELAALLLKAEASLERAQGKLISLTNKRPNQTALLRLELVKLGLAALDLERFCAAKTMDDRLMCVANAMLPRRN